MLRSRIYVVTDPSLAAAVQRASRALSFTPLVPDITKRVLGLDPETVETVRQNLDPEPGGPRGFLADIHDMLYKDLGPGEPLDDLGFDAAAELCRQVNAYAQGLRPRASQAVDLLVWVRHFVTVGTAQFLYGPENPMALRPELEQAFWDFDRGLGALMVNIAPSVTARKPFRAREALASAFTDYVAHGRWEAAGSAIVQKRVRIAAQYGFPASSTARSELSFLFAAIVNTATTTFWVVLQLFARPELLQAVRAELRGTLRQQDDGGGGGGQALSVGAVRDGCPMLHAVFRECLRTGSNNFSTRLVKTDTLLADRYFLKGGSVVQVAGGVIHADKGIWGPDTDFFNPHRFLKQQDARRNVHPAAFRSFGGGKTLCPGRHFATSEILSFVAMIVLTFDLQAAAGGEIVVPQVDDGVLPVHILEPKSNDTVEVVVRLRSQDAPPLKVVR